MDYMALADRSWPLLRRLTEAHVFLYRASRGRFGHRVLGAPPALLLDHVGARSGKLRTSPLFYARDGADVVLIASKGGHPKDPAWFHNLMANPDTTVRIGPRRLDVRARLARPEERERLWKLAVSVYRGYEGYRRRTEREIPIVVLEPR